MHFIIEVASAFEAMNDIQNYWMPIASTLILVISIQKIDSSRELPATSGLNATQIIEFEGYPYEVHEVVTIDGYILQLHRIPCSRGNVASTNRTVFLMPGLLASSAMFVNNGPRDSLAFLLANSGYDIWIGNARGTTYSKKHVFLDNRSKEYWDFSTHEIGVYDLPESIDYILNTTNRDDLILVAHSQGTTDFLIMASERPEYNNKIGLAILLAPIAYMGHMPNPLFQIFSRFTNSLGPLLISHGIYEILNEDPVRVAIGQQACRDTSPLQDLCASILFLVCGWDSDQLNKTKLPVIFSTVPAGASAKAYMHYGQLVLSGRFTNFDYGWYTNLINYRQLKPPEYNLSRITARVALYSAMNDWLSSLVDVDILRHKLPNVVHDYLVPFRRWTHLDYFYAIDINKYLNNDVIDLIGRY